MFCSTLSHKANWNGGVLSGGSILEWALRQEINTCCSCNSNVTELPQSGYWMMRLYIYPGAGWRCLEAENVLTMELCRNVYNVNSWSGWERLATAADLAEKVSKGGDTMTGILAFSDIMGSDRHAEIIQWNGETHIRNTVGGSDYQDIVIKPDGLYYSGFADGVSFNYQIAPPTPPQVYALPLAAGFSEYLPCRYWRTRDGEVKAMIRIAFDAASGGPVCAVLPAGYRPGMSVSVTFTAHFDNGAVGFGHADLEPDGSVKLYPYQPFHAPGNAILNPFVFVAGH